MTLMHRIKDAAEDADALYCFRHAKHPAVGNLCVCVSSARQPKFQVFSGRSRTGPARASDPFRQYLTETAKNLHFSREIDPTPPILLAGGGGRGGKKTLSFLAILAFRQFPALADWLPSYSPVVA